MNVETEKEMTISALVERITTHFADGDHVSLECLKSELAVLKLDACEKFVDFDCDKYHKVVLHREDQFEIILICWSPFQQTPFHSHPDNGCLMKVLEGRLNEKRNDDTDDNGSVLEENNVSFLNGGEQHTITNLGDNSISLHVYSPSRFYD